jgi:hypothetical protein
MTANHSYNTPAKGTLDWHLLLNENFNRLERDVPVVDVEANRDTYVPYSGTMFFATDTGRRFVGDGDAWTELPYPDSTTSSGGSADDSTSGTTTTANVVVSTSGGTASAARDGSEFSSGSAENVLNDVMNDLQDGDHVLLQSGDYLVNTPKTGNNLNDITWESSGSMTLDDQGEFVPWMVGFPDCDGVTIVGGTYDYDIGNNTDDGRYGTQSTLNVKRSTNIEIKETTLLNAADMFIGGNDATFVNIHHNDMRGSGERGVYMSQDASDIEVHNNIIRGVRSGAIRSNEGPTRWYIHDNEIVMDPSKYGPIYLLEGGTNDIRIENDRGILHGTGEVLNMEWNGPNGELNRNVTITGGYYEGTSDISSQYQRFADLKDTDLSSISVSADTELVEMPIIYPEIHE